MAAELPQIEAEAISPLVDMTRSAGIGQRAAAQAWGAVSDVADQATNLLAHYGEAVNAGETAKIRTAVDQDYAQLAAEHSGDPDSFREKAASMRSEILERVPSRMANVAGAYIDHVTGQHQTALVRQKVELDTADAKAALTDRKGVLEAKLAGFERQGPDALQTPEYMATFGEYSDTLRSLGNPIYGSTLRQAEAQIEVAQTRAKVGAVLSTARDVYAKSGMAPAKQFIEDTVNSSDLNLSLADRQALENRAKEEINLINQAAIEKEREAKEAERAKKDAQRDKTDDFLLDAFMGGATQAGVMAAIKADEITEGQGVRILQAIKSKQRADAAEQRMASAFAKKSTAEAILAAAGGDKDAAKNAVKMQERGLIGSGDVEDVARAYHAAKNNPQIAAAIDFISTHLVDKADDRSGAITAYMRQAGLGMVQPGNEMNVANQTIAKYRGRGYSTLEAPMFGAGVPRTNDDVARAGAEAKKARADGRISQATYDTQVRLLSAWKARIAANPARK